MTVTDSVGARTRHEVLLAHGAPVEGAVWLTDMAVRLQSSGWTTFRTATRVDAIRRVEQGGLAAAVLVGDRREIAETEMTCNGLHVRRGELRAGSALPLRDPLGVA